MEKDNVIHWLKEYWFIGVFLVTTSIAWAETTTKVQSLEEAVKRNAETQAKVEVLDERTKSIKEEQQHQRELLERMLRSQERIEKNSK